MTRLGYECSHCGMRPVPQSPTSRVVITRPTTQGIAFTMTLSSLWQPFTLGRLERAHLLGRFALANPDVVERLSTHAPLNYVDRGTLYAGGARGYVDHPVLTHA